MSTDATTPSNAAAPVEHPDAPMATANGNPDKGKGKTVEEPVDEDDEDEDEDEEAEGEDDGDEEEEDFQEIDPSVILAPGTRRTRGVKVDYSSEEALAKAGLKPETADEDEGGDSFVAPDDEMQDD